MVILPTLDADGRKTVRVAPPHRLASPLLVSPGAPGRLNTDNPRTFPVADYLTRVHLALTPPTHPKPEPPMPRSIGGFWCGVSAEVLPQAGARCPQDQR